MLDTEKETCFKGTKIKNGEIVKVEDSGERKEFKSGAKKDPKGALDEAGLTLYPLQASEDLPLCMHEELENMAKEIGNRANLLGFVLMLVCDTSTDGEKEVGKKTTWLQHPSGSLR